MDDLIQFAAYVIIFIIIGIASLIKKTRLAKQQRLILEERKKRATEEKAGRGLSVPTDITGTSRSGREEEETGWTEPEETLAPDEEAIPAEQTPQEIDMEEALRRALGLPSMEKPKPVVRPKIKLSKKITPKKTPVRPDTDLSPDVTSEQAEAVKPEPIQPAAVILEPLPVAEEKDSPWLTRLDKSGYSELKKMVIFSEVIAPPVSSRRLRNRIPY